MSTVILKWNPSFSSFTMMDFLNGIGQMNMLPKVEFNWSVWDYDMIHPGDEIFWVKVGYGQTGIVGHGKTISEPYEGEDWSGKGRKTFYVDFEADFMICPDAFQLLDSDTLQDAIPDFDWHKGHSGLVLRNDQAARLHQLWRIYREANVELFKNAKHENLGFKRCVDETIFDDGSTTVSIFINLYYVELKVVNGTMTSEVSLSDADNVLSGFGCTSILQLGNEFKRRYSHPHAVEAFTQDLIQLHINFESTFEDESEEDDK